MPTRKEREYYSMGFRDGFYRGTFKEEGARAPNILESLREVDRLRGDVSQKRTTRPKRKLSAWNKYVKANSKKPRFRYRNGKLNLKKMAVAFRKTSKRGGKR